MEDVFDTDTIVIGAGAVGLACARACCLAGHETIVIEAETAIGTQSSSRNSEVIHAGLYYPTGSAKARLCVEGRRQLYDFLAHRAIPARRCAKLVVASDSAEVEALRALKDRAEANGVEGVHLIDGNGARRMEPALSPGIEAALHSTVSGIFDSHAYMLALQGDLEAAGGHIAFACPARWGTSDDKGIVLVTGGAHPARLRARRVINAAGHNAVALARCIHGPHTAHLPNPRFVKGSYFSVRGKIPFSRLIYPMPDKASLGLHLTLDLGGRARVGPDAEWLPVGAAPPFDHRVDPARAAHFHDQVRRYWPGMAKGALSPDYAGVRPKLVGPGEPAGDFRIEGPGHHGTPGLVNLFGIESPGLTASLAIGDHVAGLVA